MEQVESKPKCRREIILAQSPQQAATDSTLPTIKRYGEKKIQNLTTFIIRLFF
jgi:hypothetical protein